MGIRGGCIESSPCQCQILSRNRITNSIINLTRNEINYHRKIEWFHYLTN